MMIFASNVIYLQSASRQDFLKQFSCHVTCSMPFANRELPYKPFCLSMYL